MIYYLVTAVASFVIDLLNNIDLANRLSYEGYKIDFKTLMDSRKFIYLIPLYNLFFAMCSINYNNSNVHFLIESFTEQGILYRLSNKEEDLLRDQRSIINLMKVSLKIDGVLYAYIVDKEGYFSVIKYSYDNGFPYIIDCDGKLKEKTIEEQAVILKEALKSDDLKVNENNKIVQVNNELKTRHNHEYLIGLRKDIENNEYVGDEMVMVEAENRDDIPSIEGLYKYQYYESKLLISEIGDILMKGVTIEDLMKMGYISEPSITYYIGRIIGKDEIEQLLGVPIQEVPVILDAGNDKIIEITNKENYEIIDNETLIRKRKK